MKRTLHSYFNKTSESQNIEVAEPPPPPVQTAPTVQTIPVETTHLINTTEINLSNLERDPGLRQQMFEYAVNQRDEIRRAYIMLGPYQPRPPLDKSFKITKGRRFMTSWYKLFPDWLEYSPSKDCAFCLPYFLFCNPSERSGSTAFIIEGFRAWKKVNDGKNCAFLVHVGNSNSPHRLAICKLASSYYHPEDFSEQEKLHLKFQLEHYVLDVRQHSEFQNLTTLSKLCQVLAKTKKLTIYPLVDRLIRLVLTLPVSTITTERAFSAMKFVKNKLRNKMEDDFLEDYLIVYIEKDIAEKIDNDSIIDAFYKMKSRRLALE